MGPASDEMAVVDSRLRVHGVNHLRVVDSSIIPKVIAGKSDSLSANVDKERSNFSHALLRSTLLLNRPHLRRCRYGRRTCIRDDPEGLGSTSCSRGISLSPQAMIDSLAILLS